MRLNKIFQVLCILTVLSAFSAGTCFSAASLDVTNMTASGNVLILKAVVSDTFSLKAGGFNLTFPTDRLTFLMAGAPDGVILRTSLSGATLTAGYMVTSGSFHSLEINIAFQITGNAPYLVAANSASFMDDLAGCTVTRPGLYGSSDVPVMWSVPDKIANLFIYVPNFSKITDLSMEMNGQDVLAAVLDASVVYVDPVMDTAYLVLPGIELPAASYPVTLTVGYGEKTETVSTSVVVK